MSKRVLLIEDHEQNRYLLTYLLQKRGYSVESAPDGMRGIELALATLPDVILLDIQLPHMDGYTVARELLRHETLRAIPIIAVTSYAMPGDRDKALAAGCCGYIEKPINPETFIAEMERFIAAKQA